MYIGSQANQMSYPNITQKKLKWVKDGNSKLWGWYFNAISRNGRIKYDMVMETVSNLIHHWSKRNLTVLGRITVVKSLLIPKFNNLIFFIPNPSRTFWNACKRWFMISFGRIRRTRLVGTNSQMIMLMVV